MRNLLCISLLMAGGLSAQSIERSVIGAAGGSGSTGSVQVDWTSGEAAVTTVEAGAFILNQGFHQGDLSRTSIEPEIRIGYRLYPNPARERVTVHLSADRSVQLRLEMSDAAGRSLGREDREVRLDPDAELSWDLSGWAEGYYLLTVRDLRGRVVHTFRIEKKL
ncbi:MAG: T9SS type A sorting domain-containing protein [Bacteroidia bacterium]|nr:T9SS type A sorting domain-containing protein [Bacteroidia bacterium]